MAAIAVVTDEVRQRMMDELTTPGGSYEVIEENIRGIKYKFFKSRPENLREMYALGTEKESFYAKVMIHWFGDLDFPALVYRDERYSYKEIVELAARLAWRMKQQYAIKKGDRVAIAMRNYPEFCLSFMATTALGALAVPLNAWWEGPELEYALQDSEPKLIFADTQRAERLAPYLKDLEIPLVIVRPEGNHPNEWTPYQDLIAGSTEEEFPPAEVDIDDDAYIMYTSGSTGRPKGVVTTHRAVITTCMTWQYPTIGLAYLNRKCLDEAKPSFMPATLLMLPMFHVTGLLSSFLSGFGLKRKMVMMYKWDPEEALRLIEKERVTHFSGVPTMSWEMVNSPILKKHDITSLAVLSAGGAARPPKHVKMLEEILGRHITQAGYGLTETTAVGCINAGENYAVHPDSVGRPSPPIIEAKIVDPAGNPLLNGDIGEICFKSTANLRCYWKNTEATDEIFLDDGWIRTGDVGLMDEEGFVYIKDRVKDLVIRGGENIACQEVEDALYEHPYVYEAAVFGLPEERLGEQVAAVIMVRPGEQLAEQELKDFLDSRLAKFKIPSIIWFQKDPLPRGATDKIYKKGIREEKLKEIQ
jgi:long-chain acyl-CoA synthetase